MQRGNSIVAFEVSAIKGKYAFHSVNVHNGDQPRVINLDALDSVVVNDAFPRGVDRWYIGQQGQGILDAGELPQRFLRREAESVPVGGAGRDIPKLRNVLGTKEDGFFLP